MSLNPIRPGLRTIHNGSAFVAKASIIVAPGAELTVPVAVADQLQRDGAFKDGPAPEASVELEEAEETATAIDAEDAPAKPEVAPDAAEVRAPAKASKKKA